MIEKIFTCILFIICGIKGVFAQNEFTISLHDSLRNRVIPLAVYQPKKVTVNTKVVIFNHGYDGNRNPGSNKSYSYLTRFLSEKGYYVISIQHELSSDPLLAMDGNFMETRMPNWKRGVENILFAICEFKKLKPELDWNNMVLIGHSNGGDMTMLFAREYPQLISKAITLDHRRMVIPRVSYPRIYTLRGSDYDADAGVIPSFNEQKDLHITVKELEGITHSDMGQRGSTQQHDTINRYILDFLKD